MSRAEQEIAARAYEARKLAIGRHHALVAELIGKKYAIESALNAAGLARSAFLSRAYVQVAAQLAFLQGTHAQ